MANSLAKYKSKSSLGMVLQIATDTPKMREHTWLCEPKSHARGRDIAKDYLKRRNQETYPPVKKFLDIHPSSNSYVNVLWVKICTKSLPLGCKICVFVCMCVCVCLFVDGRQNFVSKFKWGKYITNENND
jgi:hypothetical protein